MHDQSHLAESHAIFASSEALAFSDSLDVRHAGLQSDHAQNRSQPSVGLPRFAPPPPPPPPPVSLRGFSLTANFPMLSAPSMGEMADGPSLTSVLNAIALQ